MTPTQREAALRLIDALQSGADDPMWAHHAEIKKSTLGYAAALLRELAGVEVLPYAPTYTEQQIADACMAAEVPDSKCESVLLALRA